MRLMALGIRFPFKRLSMKEVRLVKVVVGIRPEFFDQLLELCEVRLINFNSSLTVEDAVDDLAIAARDVGGRTTILIPQHITRDRGHYSSSRLPRATAHIRGGS